MIHLVLESTESGSNGTQLSTDISASIVHNAVATLAGHVLSLVEFASHTFNRHPICYSAFRQGRVVVRGLARRFLSVRYLCV